MLLNPLIPDTIKSSNTLKQFIVVCRGIFLNVYGHFVGSGLKVLSFKEKFFDCVGCNRRGTLWVSRNQKLLSKMS